MSTLSYILVAYKSNDTIADALQSIKNQAGDFDKEVIVVDNYPEQGCAEIVLRVFPDAKLLINRRNEGFTRALNQAVSVAKGDYLFYLNPDVRLLTDCSQKLLEGITSDFQIAAVAPQLRHTDGSVQKSVRNLPTFSTILYEHSGLPRLFPQSRLFGRWRNLYFDHHSRSFVEQPMASALLVRHDVQQQLGEWDERFFVFFSDVDFCRRVRDAGYRILFEPAAQASHVGGGSTRKEGSWLIYDSHRGFYRYLVKHNLRGFKAVLRPLVGLLLSVSAVGRDVMRRLLRRSF